MIIINLIDDIPIYVIPNELGIKWVIAVKRKEIKEFCWVTRACEGNE